MYRQCISTVEMTTSHRPQLEARNGAKNTPSNAEHARLLPSHRKVKYRKPQRDYSLDAEFRGRLNGSATVEATQQTDKEDAVERESETQSMEKPPPIPQNHTETKPTKKVKKSWRQNTTFSGKKQPSDLNSNKHINDMSKSSYHQQFMDKFIK